MTKKQSRIPFTAIARTTFDTTYAQQITQHAVDQLQQSGVALLMADSLITDPMGVQAYLAISDQLEAVDVDLLLVFQSPFADSTLVTSLVEGLTPGLPCHRSSCGQYRNRRLAADCGSTLYCGSFCLPGRLLEPPTRGKDREIREFLG
jgi:hypothetical protein